MYAIIKTGGKQYRVEENAIIEIEQLSAQKGDEVRLDVMLLGTDDGIKVGTPLVQGAQVVGKVLDHFRGEKINGFTYKSKKNIQRHFGHRQSLSRVKIEKIEVGK